MVPYHGTETSLLAEMTIAALARAGGVGVETVRYYQRRGLMPEPPRPDGPGLGGGVRRYGEEEVRRLRFIKSAQTAGFTLEEIGELIELDATYERPRAREMAQARIAAPIASTRKKTQIHYAGHNRQDCFNPEIPRRR